MSKIAFMFPGQGSFEAGMGRDIALAVPEAMAIPAPLRAWLPFAARAPPMVSPFKATVLPKPGERLMPTMVPAGRQYAVARARATSQRRTAGLRPRLRRGFRPG